MGNDLLARGRAAHPTFVVDDAAFAAYLEPHAGEEPRNAPDLYLACAIASGDSAAIAHFTTHLEPAIRAVVVRLVKDLDLAADVIAAVREKLVVGRGPSLPPRIADYGGYGDLVVWVRVIAIRTALDQLRAYRREVPADDQLWELVSPSAGPALATLKRDSAAHIKAAFHASLAALTPRQRNLLRQHLIDDLTIDELGAIYQVHRVTTARWLTTARSDLWSHARKQLRNTLGLSDREITEMLEEVRSTLDLSIERALAT